MSVSRAGTRTKWLIALCLSLTAANIVLLTCVGGDAQWDAEPAADTFNEPETKAPVEAFADMQTYSAIWLKPLFNPSRAPERGATVSVKSSGLAEWVLTGTVITPTFRVALFKSSGKTLAAHEGQTLSQDWQVSSIEPRKVTVTKGATEQTFQLPVARSQPPPP